MKLCSLIWNNAKAMSQQMLVDGGELRFPIQSWSFHISANKLRLTLCICALTFTTILQISCILLKFWFCLRLFMAQAEMMSPIFVLRFQYGGTDRCSKI